MSKFVEDTLLDDFYWIMKNSNDWFYLPWTFYSFFSSYLTAGADGKVNVYPGLFDDESLSVSLESKTTALAVKVMYTKNTGDNKTIISLLKGVFVFIEYLHFIN